MMLPSRRPTCCGLWESAQRNRGTTNRGIYYVLCKVNFRRHGPNQWAKAHSTVLYNTSSMLSVCRIAELQGTLYSPEISQALWYEKHSFLMVYSSIDPWKYCLLFITIRINPLKILPVVYYNQYQPPEYTAYCLLQSLSTPRQYCTVNTVFLLHKK